MGAVSKSTDQHRESAGGEAVRCAVLTVSDTRTAQTDVGGQVIRHILDSAGHTVVEYAICPDDSALIGEHVDRWVADDSVQVVLITGGTGISRRDTTIEVVEARLTAKLDGFGELFRMISWEQIGAAAMLTRASAGVVIGTVKEGGDTFVFSMPGSVNAVETAMHNLIAPELSHMVWERTR